MPVNKNAYLRYQLINQFLQKRRYPSLNAIISYLESNDICVSRPTLEKDLYVMRNEFNLPIAYDRFKEGYYYTDPAASLDSTLSNEDLETIWVAIDKLSQFRHSDAFKNVNKSLERIMSRLKIDLDKKREGKDKIIYYEPEPYFVGSDWLSAIYDAIRDERMISFTFNLFDSPTAHLLKPYFLKEFAGRWYVIGLEEGKVVSFGLDRIVELVTTGEFFKRSSQIARDIGTLLEMNLGVFDFLTRSHHAVIRFDASLADEIKNNPLFANHWIRKEDSKDIVIALIVIVNEAFVMKAVFPYGDKATVLSPPFAVDMVVRTLTKMLDLHKAYAGKDEHKSI
jgi:predicted DNA-binding transcriptional regulator YafY